MSLFSNILNKITGKESDGIAPLGYATHEEMESKKTTKLGMFFVIIMVVAGIWQGQTLFHAIASSIHPTQKVSSCFETIIANSNTGLSIPYDRNEESMYAYKSIQEQFSDGEKSSCIYGDIEKENNIEALYIEIIPLSKELSSKNDELFNLQRQFDDIQYSRNGYRDSYNTSLLENIAHATNTTYTATVLSNQLTEREKEMSVVKAEIAKKQSEIAVLKGGMQKKINEHFISLQKVVNAYKKLFLILEVKRFITSFVLLFLPMLFALRKYFRAKNERSEFAVIWAGASLITVLLFTQVILTFVYVIIPHTLIQAILAFVIEIMHGFVFALVILQWLAFILVPLFFGYLVYVIQKKYYNKDAVIMRALKDNKCPRCTMKIKDSMIFCPACSYALRKTCLECKHTSISYAQFCEGCGASFKEKTEVVTL